MTKIIVPISLFEEFWNARILKYAKGAIAKFISLPLAFMNSMISKGGPHIIISKKGKFHCIYEKGGPQLLQFLKRLVPCCTFKNGSHIVFPNMCPHIWQHF